MNKMIISLFLFALNSNPLSLVHFEAFGNLQQGREESSVALSTFSHLLLSYLPILTLRKSLFPSVQENQENFILHIKNKYMYMNMHALYRQFCVPLLQSV